MATAAGEPMERLTVHLCEPDQLDHRSLVVALLDRARRMGLAGATVFEASEGEGRSGTEHHQHLLRNDVPLAVVIVDRREQIEEFLTAAAGALGSCLVLRQDVVALRP